MLTNRDMNDLLMSTAADKKQLTQAEIRAWLVRLLGDETMPCTINLDRRAYLLNVSIELDMVDLMGGKL